jgi:L-malate glycosyltransferase
MPPIGIAFVIDTIETPAAGTERQLLALLHGLDRHIFAPHLVCLRESAWLSTQRFGFPVTVIGIRSLARASVLGALLRFRSYCLEHQIGIVQTFFVDANLFGTLGGALARRPVIVSSRRNIGHWHAGAHVWLLRRLRAFTDYYLANSQAAAERTAAIEHVDSHRIEIIHNGVAGGSTTATDPSNRQRQRAAWGVQPAEILVGCIANLRDIKNLPELVTAAEVASASHPRLRFVIVGEGPARAALEAQVVRAGLAGRFQLAGRALDVGPALAAFDIAVQCSKAESSSNSLIEYMAAGLAIVASAVPGNLETISPEETALFYTVGEPMALSAALCRLADDRALRERIGRAARRVAEERYSMTRCIAEHERFYRRVVDQRASP